MAKKKRPTKKKPLKEALKNPQGSIPLWTLEKDGVTNSILRTWQLCPETCALSYIEGLTNTTINEPMEYGSLFHCCKENRGKLSPMEAMAPYRAHAAKTHNLDYMQALDHLIHKVAAIFPIYEKVYPLKKEPTPFRHEAKFAAPRTVLAHGSIPVEVTLRGKRDHEFKTPQGRYGLMELKTKSSVDIENVRHLLRCDMQTLLYLWSMREEYGECPTTLIYDVVKRPTLLVTKKETLAEHYKRLAEHAEANQGMYFLRWHINTIKDSDLDRFEREILDPTLRAFTSWWLSIKKNPFDRFQSPLHHLNLTALSDPWKKSEFYDLLVLGQRKNYFRRSSAHPELDDLPETTTTKPQPTRKPRTLPT